MTDMYGRQALLVQPNAFPFPQDESYCDVRCVARSGDVLACGVTLRTETMRHALMVWSPGEAPRTFALPNQPLEVAFVGTAIRVLTTGLEVATLEGDSLRVVAPPSHLIPLIPEGISLNPDYGFRDRHAFTIDSRRGDVWVLLGASEKRLFRCDVQCVWSEVATLALESPISMAMHDEELLVVGTRIQGHNSKSMVCTWTSKGWKEFAARFVVDFQRGKVAADSPLYVRTNPSGQAIGRYGSYEFVRYLGKGEFERPYEKWQLTGCVAECVSEEAWCFFQGEPGSVVERRATLPFKATKPAAEEDAKPSGPKAAKPAKLLKLKLKPEKFPDPSLYARNAGLRHIHFISNEVLIALGHTPTELVLHVFRLQGDAWSNTKRLTLPLLEPVPANESFDKFGGIITWDATRALCWLQGLYGRVNEVVLFDASTDTLTRSDLLQHGLPLVHANGVTAFVSPDATLAFVDTQGGVVARTRETYGFPIACVVGDALWLQHHDKPEGTLREVDVKTGAVLREAKGTPYARIALHPDRKSLLCATSAAAYRFDPTTLTATSQTLKPTGDMGALPNGELWMSGGYLKPIRLFDDAWNVRVELDLQHKTDWIHGLHTSPDGRWLAARYFKAFSLIERKLTELKLVPLAAGTSPEDACEKLYPGFLANLKTKRAIKSWQLGFALFENLLAAGLIAPFELSVFASVFPKKKINLEHEDLIPEAAACVHFLAETCPKLSALQSLAYEVNGNALQFEVYPFFDGEDATFCITDLRGIELCAGLEDVALAVGDDTDKPVDVSPLAKLPKLQTLALRGPIEGLAKLKTHAALKRVSVDDATSKDAEALRAAGIEVVAH